MAKPTVLVLGGSGCLGSALIRELASAGNDYIGTFSSNEINTSRSSLRFTVGEDIGALLRGTMPDVIINSIVAKNRGVLPLSNSLASFQINTFFPRQLARVSSLIGAKVLNISTNAVFRGTKGEYCETSFPFPRDTYGLSKLLGESKSNNVHNIRFSFVPKTLTNAKKHRALDWVLNATEILPVTGFLNHAWNGLTEEMVAKLLVSVVNNQELLGALPPTLHLFSRDVITKFELYETLLEHYSLPQDMLVSGNSPHSQKLTLSSDYIEFLNRVWATAGFSKILSFQELI